MLLQNRCEGCCKGSAVRIIKGNSPKGKNKKANTKQKNVQRLNMASSGFELTLCQSPAGKQAQFKM